MKTNTSGKFAVSFNTEIEWEEFGEIELNTVDFYGDDVDELVKEVLADAAPDFTLSYEPNGDGISTGQPDSEAIQQSQIVGRFIGPMNTSDEQDQYPVAVLYRQHPHR